MERLNGQVIKISPTSTPVHQPHGHQQQLQRGRYTDCAEIGFYFVAVRTGGGRQRGIAAGGKKRSLTGVCIRFTRNTSRTRGLKRLPLLEDLYNALLKQEEKEAHHVATALEIYVKGSLNLFNHRTNREYQQPFSSVMTSGNWAKQLKKIGCWWCKMPSGAVSPTNRYAGKTTRFYVDEFHLLLGRNRPPLTRWKSGSGSESGAAHPPASPRTSKTCWPTPGKSRTSLKTRTSILNAQQASGDTPEYLAKQLNIPSLNQLSYVTHSGEGEGLLFYGNVILPFVDHVPPGPGAV